MYIMYIKGSQSRSKPIKPFDISNANQFLMITNITM